ncbi:MAG: hypothetical protein QM638_09295 [Nocardioides sp.]|uniref:hypothetical protein n=1 Tax=Nocardioides sp. TaxID=35761 RepID=UPI0039E25493
MINLRRAVATAAVTLLAAITVTACGDGDDSSTAEAALGTTLTTPTYAEVHAAVDDLWSSTAEMADFSIRSVEYDSSTVNRVLDMCHTGTAAGNEESLQSSRVTACAPLIYFLYEFGRSRDDSAAVETANDLYSYAVTRISGPKSSQKMLDTLLKSWGVDVAAGTADVTPETAAEARVDAVRTALSGVRGVRMSVRSSSGSVALFDVGTTGTTETFGAGRTEVRVLVTTRAAYLQGSRTALRRTLQITTRRSVSGWIRVSAGNAAYSTVADGTGIDDVTTSILPATTAVRSAEDEGVTVLRWRQYAGKVGRYDRHTLRVDAGLPVSSTVVSSAGDRTVTRFSWGPVDAIAVPAHAVPLRQLSSAR